MLVSKAGHPIKEEFLKNSYDNNGDGCGLSFVENGKLHIRKGMWQWERFLTEYNKVKNLDLIIHFRLASRGEKTASNCHPFLINGGKFSVSHNGTINIKTREKESDTKAFAELVIEKFLEHGIDPAAPYFKYLIEQAIGPSNKIALMDSTGKIIIYNEGAGDWNREGQFWSSNWSYNWKKVIYTNRTYDNKYWENWHNNGTTQVKKNATGISSDEEEAEYQQLSDDDKIDIWFAETEMNLTRKQAMDWVKARKNKANVTDEVIDVQ